MILPYRRFADFRGRSPRGEFWRFLLLWLAVLLGALALNVIEYQMQGSPPDGETPPESVFGWIVNGLTLAFIAVSIVPLFALQVRRFHDLGKSGWFVLLNLIPYGGTAAVLLYMGAPGTMGENEYGPDPLEGKMHASLVERVRSAYERLTGPRADRPIALQDRDLVTRRSLAGWMVLPFQRCFEFKGRSRRREYWSFVLLNALAMGVAVTMILSGERPPEPDLWLLFLASFEGGPVAMAGGVLLAAWTLAVTIPFLSLGVRRLHDRGYNGWWIVYYLGIGAIPIVGYVVTAFYIFRMVQEGEAGPNRYGPDPKGRPALDDFF